MMKAGGGGGVPAASGGQLLFQLLGANMQATTDQQFSQVFGGVDYYITHVIATRVSGAASVACAGGIYTGAGKTGDALVAAAQSWVTLATGKTINAAVAAIAGTNLESAIPYLTLTTGSTAACTANIYIFGYPVVGT